MSARVSEIMSRRVVTLNLDDRLSEAKEIFDNVSFHHLPVIDDGELVGVLTKKDMEFAISPYIGQSSELPRDVQTLEKRIHQVMTRDPIHLSHDYKLRKAVEIMLDNGISCLPVTNKRKQVVGIITWRDLLRECLSELP